MPRRFCFALAALACVALASCSDSPETLDDCATNATVVDGTEIPSSAPTPREAVAAYLSAGGSTSGATAGTQQADYTEAGSGDGFAVYEARDGAVVLAATHRAGRWSITTVTAC